MNHNLYTWYFFKWCCVLCYHSLKILLLLMVSSMSLTPPKLLVWSLYQQLPHFQERFSLVLDSNWNYGSLQILNQNKWILLFIGLLLTHQQLHTTSLVISNFARRWLVDSFYLVIPLRLVWRNFLIDIKGSPDPNYFIFEINVGNGRIRHRMTPNLNEVNFQNWFKMMSFKIQNRSMSDPTLSDIDFKIKMDLVQTTLN